MTSTSQHSSQPPRSELLPPLPSDPVAPAQSTSWSSKIFAAVGVLVAVLYLANIGAGLFELGPDFLPGVGNLDEVLFTAVLIYCLRQLGIDLLPHLRRSSRTPQ